MATLVNVVCANTILAVGTVAVNTLQVQYIFDPKIYTKTRWASSLWFTCTLLRSHYSLVLSKKKQSTSYLLGKTSQTIFIGIFWEDSTDTFACALVPNVFFTYFGQSLPTSCITFDATKWLLNSWARVTQHQPILPLIPLQKTQASKKSSILVRTLTITISMFFC